MDNLSPVLLALVTVAITFFAYLLLSSPANLKRKSSIPRILQRVLIPRLGAVRFYTHREDFLREELGDPVRQGKNIKQAVRFNIKDHVVIGTGGSEVAKTFFNTRSLSFNQAYQVMLGGGPLQPTSAGHASADKRDQFFIQQLRNAIRTERLRILTTSMVDDCLACFTSLPSHTTSNGLLDTHAVIYPLVFQLSVRTVGCAEIANDPKAIANMESIYWGIEKNTSFATTHLKFLPLKGTAMRKKGGEDLFGMNYATIVKRVEEGRREEDAVQDMLDKDIRPDQIALFIISALFAAVINSTGMASWLLIFVGANPELRARVQEEIDSTLRRSAQDRGEDYDKLTTSERIRNVSLEDWESSFPLVEASLKETMRLLMTATVLRVYLGGSKGGADAPSIAGEQLRPNDFLAYWLSSTHYNAETFREPLKFDPDRWARGEGSREFEFLGWGAGLHPCTGMRFAKLEMKVVATTFFATFVHSTTDDKGVAYTPEALPRPDLNDQSFQRIPLEPVRLAYKLRDNFVPSP